MVNLVVLGMDSIINKVIDCRGGHPYTLVARFTPKSNSALLDYNLIDHEVVIAAIPAVILIYYLAN